MARVVRLIIEDDPDEIEIRIESATEERAAVLAQEIIVPVIRSWNKVRNEVRHDS